jgi:hypothetical protein
MIPFLKLTTKNKHRFATTQICLIIVIGKTLFYHPLFFFLSDTGVWTQSLVLARQALLPFEPRYQLILSLPCFAVYSTVRYS